MVRIELTTAIRVVHAGRRYLPVPVASQLYGDSPRVKLTPRELDVLRSIAGGNANKAIAKESGIPDSTVEAHVQTFWAS